MVAFCALMLSNDQSDLLNHQLANGKQVHLGFSSMKVRKTVRVDFISITRLSKFKNPFPQSFNDHFIFLNTS